MAAEARRAPTLGGLGLVLSVAASWVGVAQLARLAEQRTEAMQRHSAVPLMTCANCNAWMALAIPHMLRRARELRGPAAAGEAPRARGCGSVACALLRTDAFSASQPLRFLLIAVTTNCCYMAALHFMPASLNTAIFCTNPIFTLLLSWAWLPSGDGELNASGGLARPCLAAACSRQSLSVMLSVAGVVLIAQPWRGPAGAVEGDSLSWRATGACLSLLAAFGTAAYQVYFKATFGDRLRPDEVGLFLARMGAFSVVLLSSTLTALLATGIYPLRLEFVPWGLIIATAASSMLFNFLIKFGISIDSPMAMSLATQIGIPLNLLLDVLVVHANIDRTQVLGTVVMLCSFTLQQLKRNTPASGASLGRKLLDR